MSSTSSWTYNNRGFNVAKSYPDGTGPSYSYDADGKLQTRTWARGVVATYAYDAAGRASGVSYSDETPAIAVSYDFLGRAVTITDASGTKNLTYNSNSQLENETIPHIVNLSIQYGYDAYGRQTLRQLKQNDAVHASVSLSYDSRGRTATVGNGADVLHYAYRPGRNQLETAEWKNAQNAVLNSRSYAYDSHHRLTGINLNGTLEVGYTLNDKDRRTGAEYANSGLWNFIYDDKGQVTSALGSSRSFAYAYDGIGNRTAATEGGEQFSYASNQLNQYTAVNASQPTYDADGNLLTTGTGWTCTWNGENRLIAAENGDTRLEFNYDCMGRRFEKKVYTANVLTKHEKFVYDGYKLTAVYDVLENNALRMTFAWQPDSVDLDVPVSMTCDGETYYYVTDGNKNVTALLDADGVRVAKYTYNPFGRILNSEGALAEINPFRFSSEYHDDETGLVYYNYRYYSPELGRWIKRDPIEEEGEINLYLASKNNLVFAIDYLGLADYKLGTDDPIIKHDAGAGTWGSESATLDMMSLRFLIVSSAKDFLWLPDAWAHLRHYLGNSGKTYTIRFQKMIDDLKSLQAIRAGEIADARKFVMNLSDGTYNITSGRATNGYARFSESSNWFYAVGGYSVWGKGQVTVSNKQTCFEIKYEFKFEDRYNWDAGKSVNILGVTITDDFMGKFQRQGLAREFNMIGSVKQTIKWKKGDKAPVITEGWDTPKGGR